MLDDENNSNVNIGNKVSRRTQIFKLNSKKPVRRTLSMVGTFTDRYCAATPLKRAKTTALDKVFTQLNFDGGGEYWQQSGVIERECKRKKQ